MALVLNPMPNDKKFEPGIFSVNAAGETAFTTVPNRWRSDWDNVAKLVPAADESGLEFILPIARWKALRRPLERARCVFRKLTNAAAVAAITRRVAGASNV